MIEERGFWKRKQACQEGQRADSASCRMTRAEALTREPDARSPLPLPTPVPDDTKRTDPMNDDPSILRARNKRYKCQRVGQGSRPARNESSEGVV